jgi:hypothetical protein
VPWIIEEIARLVATTPLRHRTLLKANKKRKRFSARTLADQSIALRRGSFGAF